MPCEECDCPDCIFDRKAERALEIPFFRLCSYVDKIAMLETYRRGVAERRYEASKCSGVKEHNCGK